MINKDGLSFPDMFDLSVCIVGGHDDSIIDNWISDSDIVVCVNDHYKRQKINLDVYFGGNDLSAIPENKIRLACINRGCNYELWQERVSSLFTFDRERSIYPKENPSNEWLNIFQHSINGNPLSGMIALRWFSLLPVQCIKVCAMDFYRDEHGKIPEYIWPHNIRDQCLWARELWRIDTRLQYSPHLMGVLELNGEEKGQMFGRELVRGWYRHDYSFGDY